MKTAALMARVSSDEQALGYSLSVQEDSLRTYCKSHDIGVAHSFREDYSAKNFDRPEFANFLKFAKLNKGKIDYLLFTTWDRFCRNAPDAYVMIARLKKLGIQPMAIQQPLDISIPENKMILALYLVLPEIDNDRRSIKIREGIKKALQSGRWCTSAPRGYSYNSDHHSKSIIEPNSSAQHIRSLFEQYDQGISQADIIKDLCRKGFKIGKSVASKILRNPVYMGKILVPGDADNPALLVKGIHEAIISEELFNRVQSRLDGFRKVRNRPVHNSVRDELPYRGLLLCPDCGNKLTGSGSKSRTGKRHFYYHCNHCGKARIRADFAEVIIGQVIDELHVEEPVKILYQKMVQVAFQGSAQERSKRLVSISTEIEKNEVRIRNLQDKLADGDLTTSDFSSMKGRYEIRIQDLTYERNKINSAKASGEQYLDSGINLISNLQLYWKSADKAQKNALVSSIFPEKLEIAGKKCRTTRINELFRLILQETRDLDKKKTGQLTPHLLLSRRVETNGIEPSTS